MCTAIRKNNLFGRTLDLEYSYGESVTFCPRNAPLSFRYAPQKNLHSAFIGCAHVRDGMPLWYDGLNEHGLSVAALSFPVSAVYAPPRPSLRNLCSFEVIPAVLAECKSLLEARSLLSETHVTDDAVASSLPPSPLHWMIADREGSFVAEPTAQGLQLYDNPADVLTNEPPFPYQMLRLSEAAVLSPTQPKNTLCPDLSLPLYSRGMGAIGLPGDASSSSRFVRGVYTRCHTILEHDEEIEGFFHILDTVAQPKGFALTDKGEPIYTVYSDCMDLSALRYSYTTYGCRSIRTRSMQEYDLDGNRILWSEMT